MNTSAGGRCKIDRLWRSREGTAFTDLERVQDQIRVVFRDHVVVSAIDSKTSSSAELGKAKAQLLQIFIASFTERFLSTSVRPQTEYFLSTMIFKSLITLGGRYIALPWTRKLKGGHLNGLSHVLWGVTPTSEPLMADSNGDQSACYECPSWILDTHSQWWLTCQVAWLPFFSLYCLEF